MQVSERPGTVTPGELHLACCLLGYSRQAANTHAATPYGNSGHGCTQAPRQFTKTLTLRANDLNQVRAVKDAISRHLEQRGGVDHMLPRGCELDTLDDGTAKLSITVRPNPSSS